MSEKIVLIGGPGDGTTYEWAGSDWLYYFEPVSVQQAALSYPAPPTDILTPHHRYRRSANSPHLFVYQP